jgi:hypothetical protein
MVAALEDEALVHEAPAIVGCQTPSAIAHAAGARAEAATAKRARWRRSRQHVSSPR